jgi:hypothetical protein
MEELAGLLGRERLLLEVLLFKLVSLRQLLTVGEVRFLPWASEEVDRATAKVREAELRRTLAVDAIAEARRVDDPAATVTLRTLAEDSPEPWRTIFAEHRRAFLELARDIEDAMGACTRLADVGGGAVTATLERLTGSEPAASRTPVAATSGPAAHYGVESRWRPGAGAAGWQSGDGARFSRTL